MEFNVIYQTWSDTKATAIVKVMETIDWNNESVFYAKNLALFGCGKHAATPEGAVRSLMASHSQFVYSITMV